ncbi:MAG: hypothetical protein AABX77_00865 [Nanoarchaeota archaeon]
MEDELIVKCCEIGEEIVEFSLDMLIFIEGVSGSNLVYMSYEDQMYMLKVYRHLKTCKGCNSVYLTFKKEMAIGNYEELQLESLIEFETFSPEKFRLIKENEKYLDGLL